MIEDGVPDDMREAFANLQREYVREAPARLAELRKDLAAFRAGEADATESLRQRFHRLAGSGGSFGLQRVTDVAREMEEMILKTTDHTTLDAKRFERAIANLKDAFDAVAGDQGSMPAALGRIPGFGWRALVVMGDTPLRATIVAGLRDAEFTVDIRLDIVDPLEIPASEHPDLVVISTDAGVDPLALARYWTAATVDRPRAVVLADPLETLDHLRTAAIGIDAVFGPDALPRDLVQYAKALAQIGAPPANVVVVEDDPAQAQLFATWLGRINATVTICATAAQARERLWVHTPDLVFLDVDLPDVDGYAIARLMRQEARLALVPIVFLTAHHTLVDQLEGLRAGGDDFLTKPVDPSHLVQLTITRVERGRRVRELVHRDGLTGLLNHSALIAELEHASAYAVRHQEPLCFMMIDLDHFKRINDSFGHLVGDQVLAHVAQIFRKQIRQADALGRYGGEEFGVVLRNCGPENAGALATRLRKALADTPLPFSADKEMVLRASIGVASLPTSGITARALTAAADRAMYEAKTSGRNRVVMA